MDVKKSQCPLRMTSPQEKQDTARLIAEAVGGLHLLAEAAALPFLGYLLQMVQAEAATIIATCSTEADVPN